MACTTQSALDYVRSARTHLVGELKNLSVILENLYQKGVLTDEEVSKIRAERDDYDKTRKILDSVTNKGEAACYEFLRIIDTTRKRTLERQPLPSKNKSDASTEARKFDLHHWISCFSFKEDPQVDLTYLQGPKSCHKYQAKLKSKARKLSNEFWKASKNLFEDKKPDLSYTSLVLDTQDNVSPSKIKKLKRKKGQMIRPKKLRTYIPEDKTEISPSDLLKTYKNIVLVGKPGIGKTALTHEMLRLWAERDNKELDYMFYFDMRETSNITAARSLEELLFNVSIGPEEGADEVLDDIKKNSENVTIILDGITDLCSSVVKSLVEKDLLPDAKIIITCRPADEDDFFYGDCVRVEVKGFSEQTIRSYLSAALGNEQEKVLTNLELVTLCHVPVYALMVAACFSSGGSPQPCTETEIYINIVRHCLQINSNKTKNKDLNSFISTKKNEILSLAEVAFVATRGKTVNLTEVSCEDSCVLSFLKPLVIKAACTETETIYAFLHYTVQEFFAALWLLKNPDRIRDVLKQCLTEEMRHMKHLIPFMCRLLSERKPTLMRLLIPADDLKNTSDWFLKEVITTFSPGLKKQGVDDSEDSGLNVDILFLCQCLYESQSPEDCIYLLDRLDYQLDLSEESLDCSPCCALAYVLSQCKERKAWLNLEDATISEQGMRQLFGCLENVQWCDPLPQQLWKIFLLSDRQMDYVTLLSIDGNQLHLPVEGKRRLFDRAVEVMQRMTKKVNVCLYGDRVTSVCQNLCESLLQALPYISSLSFRKSDRNPDLWSQSEQSALERDQKRLLLDLCVRAALHNEHNCDSVVNMLLSLFPDKTDINNLLLYLYQHVKSEGFLNVIPKLRSVFQSPTVWFINLSERKTSILLEVMKLQSEKKPVELRGCSHEESEVRSFLQCLPYISQLRFDPQSSDLHQQTRFLMNLFCAAAERENQTGEKIVELLSSVCTYQTFPLEDRYMSDDDKKYRSNFLLDLFSHVKDYETETGLRLLPSLQSVFQSPTVWLIDLSERKTSILLEVMKLQSKKKPVELIGCSHGESEVRSFLQCLPYISQLRFHPQRSELHQQTRFLMNLFCAAAERENQTGEKIVELLSSVCTYQTFPLDDRYMSDDDKKYRSNFLLDLCSHVKDYETETGLRLLPSLQSVFQSPTVWLIDPSERKTSILLEVMKLQSEKKPVLLRGCSRGESEVRSFLQCLPYISQLRFNPWSSDRHQQTRFLMNLFCAAAERENQTGEKIVELLSSVCTYQTFPLDERYMYEDKNKYQSDFLLDLCSHVKDYETKTGLRLPPSFQSVFQSPTVWLIDPSERKTSILLEVMKLQSEKKPVELRGCSHGESEVRSFLQCLPYISQLRFNPRRSELHQQTRFLMNLFCAASERENQTGEKIVELLSSVCTYQTFPLKDGNMSDDNKKYRNDFLLDLCSHVKDYETKTGLRLLPSFQSVFQSPTVWSIDLSERKTSILLEVMKLQSEKKPVELRGCSHEESEVRSFLQCLPYISQLRFDPQSSDLHQRTWFLMNLFCAAAERENQTGEEIVELLSSVCTYQTFPLNDDDMDDDYRSNFLLDLFSHVKDYETKTGLRLLPSLQSVFQSPTVWSINLSERKTSILLEVMKLQSGKKPVKLRGCSHGESEVRSFLQCLPYISQLRFYRQSLYLHEETRFLMNLFCAAAERENQTGEKIVELLSSVLNRNEFPLNYIYMDYKSHGDFLLDLFSHVKDYETKTGLRLLPSLQSVFQSPTVWLIDLSERKTSILLEVMKLQSEKNPVELRGCSHGESEVRSFLQCLPYISQLRFFPWCSDLHQQTRFLLNLFCAAAERENQTKEKIVELLSSVCTYQTFPLDERYMSDDDKKYRNDFLLDLCSHVKDYETETGLRLLPSLQSVFQSPTVWSIDLSERKTSILLEVMKLQSEKKPVELRGCSHGESEVRSFLQCLPYISQLRFDPQSSDHKQEISFFGNLFCAAAERENQTGEEIVELLSSVCTDGTFPLNDDDMDDEYRSNFLLDLFSHVKDYETETGLRLLPSFQSVFQSPTVWYIDLSERKTSILLEVMKLQSEKKPVELRGCSHGESEVRSFLQCLPYISQLRFDPWRSDLHQKTRFLMNLFCAAAERENQTGEKIVELLSSVCTYQTFPLDEDYMDDDNLMYRSDFLLDLFSHVKDYETKTGLRLLPSFQSVFQSPTVWSIDLSERKTSILLEVMKLQPEKKPVELRGCSHGESEVRSFLQCLPYISQLRFYRQSLYLHEETRFLMNLFCAAAERENQTGEKIVELLSSVLNRNEFPLNYIYMDYKSHGDFLLDLFSHVKDYETKTGLRLLPSLQSVFQSPTVWFIDLSERKTSILLEVMKLQSEKKPVELRVWSHGESEVRSFLQCLPYISQLRFDPQSSDLHQQTRFLMNLLCAAAERENQTGEKIVELLSSVCTDKTFPLDEIYMNDNFLLDLFSHVKDYETETGLRLLPSLQSVFQSPTVWFIDLSERKTSILLEVMKLQSEKKPVELIVCSHEESEVRSFLQCLPYISQLSDFLLDLFSHVKDYETETGLRLLPSLQSVFQFAPTVWFIDLSKRKTSILLEVMKLQPEKKPVELRGCSHEESEVRSFLQCLPYISQLRFVPQSSDLHQQTRFLMNLFCAAAERENQTGEKIVELLSVCTYQTFPLEDGYMSDDNKKYQSNFLLDLFSHVKDYETKTGLRLLPSLQSVFQLAPTVWFIDLSEKKTSILLEVMKLQSEKKPVKLRGCSHGESEVRSFLQCLPYISQLRFDPWRSDLHQQTRFLLNLFCAAAERENQTGEKIVELLSSVCTYQTFPLDEDYMDDDVYDSDFINKYRSNFLLDLCSHVKDYETKTGLRLLPSFQSVFQSPTVWSINLSERKTSILLEVMKLQPEKKPVKLRGCSHGESEVRSFLQCLPYISQLSCPPEFFQSVCSSISVRSREDVHQLSSLLQLLGFNLILTGKLHRKTCCSVGRVLHLCGSKVDLTLTALKMSVRGASNLFRRTTCLHSLRLSNNVALVLFQWIRRGRLVCPLVVEELHLVPQTVQPSDRLMLEFVSSLSSLLRYWTVRLLDLTESCISAQCLMSLLLHDGPLTLKLSEEILQQLLTLVLEVQDQHLTLSLLSKVGGDLSCCRVDWELLHYLLQSSDQIITVNLRKNRFLQENTTRLLPFLDRMVLRRPSPSFVMTSIRELFRAQAGLSVPGLLRSLDHVISLSCRELDSVDCAALLFVLKHSDRVKLKLLWMSIPTEGLQSILSALDRVSQLSVDRNQLLRFVHCCAASDDQQGASSGLLRTLQHSLDLSCSSCVETPEDGQTESLSLTGDDCRVVSTVLRHSSMDTQLDLRHCEVEDSGLELLFPVLNRVHLRVSQTVLLQLVSLVPVHSEEDTVRRAVSLCGALGGELDLSHRRLDQRTCGALVQMLEFSEGLTELDLSHCQLTDQLLLPLSSQLHKVQVLDLSHNQITDASTDLLLQLPSIHTVRLFSNNIKDTTPFRKDRHFEIW
ncbi:uncharacterized protein LOC125000627 isoform X3 [Mugil cephalus]|uniref:uncharacterized protein LOC125000627 isoform X3 n=1 Tax=Mugil cephalus TaxID=48193 RepID=UPI001FB7B24A|nr:uncharacterized protein LOC125000627 isoform X3 [Mugil cephalus]